jgi:hypothetical protein
MIFLAADVRVWKCRELIYSLSRTVEINKVRYQSSFPAIGARRQPAR